jgi:hypothetical protein
MPTTRQETINDLKKQLLEAELIISKHNPAHSVKKPTFTEFEKLLAENSEAKKLNEGLAKEIFKRDDEIKSLKKQNDAGDELEEMVEKCRDGVYRSKRLADSFHEGVSKRDEYYKKIVGELKQGIETLQKQVTANCSGLLKAERDTYKKQNEKLKRSLAGNLKEFECVRFAKDDEIESLKKEIQMGQSSHDATFYDAEKLQKENKELREDLAKEVCSSIAKSKKIEDIKEAANLSEVWSAKKSKEIAKLEKNLRDFMEERSRMTIRADANGWDIYDSASESSDESTDEEEFCDDLIEYEGVKYIWDRPSKQIFTDEFDLVGTYDPETGMVFEDDKAKKLHEGTVAGFKITTNKMTAKKEKAIEAGALRVAAKLSEKPPGRFGAGTRAIIAAAAGSGDLLVAEKDDEVILGIMKE